MGVSCWEEVIKSCHVFQIRVEFLKDHLSYGTLQLVALKQFLLS